MNLKDYYRHWGHGPEDYNPKEQPSYYEDTKYFNLSARRDAVKQSWSNFKKTRPACATLLELLFGDEAEEAHHKVKDISENKARMIVEMLQATTSRPTGAAFKITSW